MVWPRTTDFYIPLKHIRSAQSESRVINVNEQAYSCQISWPFQSHLVLRYAFHLHSISVMRMHSNLSTFQILSSMHFSLTSFKACCRLTSWHFSLSSSKTCDWSVRPEYLANRHIQRSGYSQQQYHWIRQGKKKKNIRVYNRYPLCGGKASSWSVQTRHFFLHNNHQFVKPLWLFLDFLYHRLRKPLVINMHLFILSLRINWTFH